MVTTKVVKSAEKARGTAATVGYLVYGKAHRAGAARYEGVTGTNGVPTTPVARGDWSNVLAAFAATRERFQNRRARHEVHHVVIGFGDGELAPENDVATALRVAHDFASEAWPTRQTFAVAQRDGEGGKLHVHVTVSNTDMLTGKAARGDEMSWTRLSPVLDSTLRDLGIKQPETMPRAGVVPEFRRRGHTRFEHEQITAGRDPRVALIDAITWAKEQATTVDEYVGLLAQRGVRAEMTAPHARKKYGAAAYTTTNSEGVEVTLVGSKLGKGAGWSAVAEAVAQNAQRETTPAAPVLRGQDREAGAAALVNRVATAAGEQARSSFIADAAEEMTEQLTRRARRKKLPEKLTPARAAYLARKGVISRDKQREYGD